MGMLRDIHGMDEQDDPTSPNLCVPILEIIKDTDASLSYVIMPFLLHYEMNAWIFDRLDVTYAGFDTVGTLVDFVTRLLQVGICARLPERPLKP
jgi:hypothetical protein